ncbi:MAG: GNAT family N-acetyltransferase [Lachnospiraceae bacterium]|nr:GNAT family N-acetyltransferase [Lachnospiraceae bacterium]
MNIEQALTIERIEKGSSLANKFVSFVESSSWEDAKEHIAAMVRNWVFTDWEAMFVAKTDDRIIAMASVMKTDYYPLPNIYPWVSCIFVTEEYRGRRISGELISHANRYLKDLGFDRSYIPTEYTGLYEHYGYSYLMDIENYGGGIDRLYVKEL